MCSAVRATPRRRISQLAHGRRGGPNRLPKKPGRGDYRSSNDVGVAHDYAGQRVRPLEVSSLRWSYLPCCHRRTSRETPDSSAVPFAISSCSVDKPRLQRGGGRTSRTERKGLGTQTLAICQDGLGPAERRQANGSAAVAVVDEHDAIHAAVKLWCSQAQPAIRFAGNYFSAEQFLAEHPSPSASSVGPIVLELKMQRSGVDFATLDQIVSRQHRVIVYSHIASDEVILTALNRGAVTYVTKSERKDHLIDAIRAAGTGTPYIGPRMALAMHNDCTVGRANLAPREKEVLIAWFRTESKNLVAQQLQIAPTTVRTHLQRVRAKYAAVGRPATTKAALVARAIQDGIVDVDDI
jgi:DNA-binding NarL/FixJ family response regulator